MYGGVRVQCAMRAYSWRAARVRCAYGARTVRVRCAYGARTVRAVCARRTCDARAVCARCAHGARDPRPVWRARSVVHFGLAHSDFAAKVCVPSCFVFSTPELFVQI